MEGQKAEIGEETKVIIEFPSHLTIELVQANEVRNYEIFQWLGTGTVSAAIGFWTTFFLSNAPWKSGTFFSAVLFTVASIILGYFAWQYRKKTFTSSIKKVLSLTEFKQNLQNHPHPSGGGQ